MGTYGWLLLTYKVPAEPASKRVALWRRLKGMGAVYLQNGVCLLPKTDDHVRRLKMLENDITEMGGDAVILETVALDRGQEDKVVARFKGRMEFGARALGNRSILANPAAPGVVKLINEMIKCRDFWENIC